MIIISNALIAITYYQMNDLEKDKKPNFILFHLSLVDTLVGCETALNFFIFETFLSVIGSKIIIKFTSLFILYLPLWTLVLYSGERYLAIKNPFYHRHVITKNVLVRAVVGIWIISFMFSLLPSLIIALKKRSIEIFLRCDISTERYRQYHLCISSIVQ